MARKTNKTDHLLNLLAGSGSGQEDAQRETAEGKGALEETGSKEAGNKKQAPDEKTGSLKETAPAGGQGAAPVYGTQTAGKNVHVVRAIGSEDPIAELIKEELETDLNRAMEKAGVMEETVMADNAVQNGMMPTGPEATEEAVAGTDTAMSEKEIPVTEETAAFAAEKGAEEEATAGGASVTAQEADTETAEQNDGTFAEEQLLEEVRGGTIEGQQKEAMPEEDTDDEMEGYVFHNMMETIVREKVPEYIRQFGVCQCKHCKADVIALALSKLPPKYVVVHESAISPLRSFYEDHYAGQITVEITKACIAVSSHPHHNR